MLVMLSTERTNHYLVPACRDFILEGVHGAREIDGNTAGLRALGARCGQAQTIIFLPKTTGEGQCTVACKLSS